MSELTYADYCWDEWRGFRQRDLTVTQVYDRAYLEQRYGGEMGAKVQALAARRLAVLEAFVIPDLRFGSGDLLDYGCGTGRFVDAANESHWDAAGIDLIPTVGPRITLSAATRIAWDAVTFFDSLEHLVDPAEVIRSLHPKAIMVSVPECHQPNSEQWFMAWKHRRPGEHLWHWNRKTLDLMMDHLGYRPLMHSDFEDDFRPRYDPALPNILSAIYQRDS